MKKSGMENKTVDDYRQQFKIAPIGRWSWAVGSSSIVMNQVWVFYSCHTGHYIDYGPFGYPRRQTHFQWREVAEFTILIGETGWEYLEPVDEDDNGEMEPEDSMEEIEWMTIRYDFKEVEHDMR